MKISKPIALSPGLHSRWAMPPKKTKAKAAPALTAAELRAAAVAGDLESVQKHVSRGGDVNEADAEGNTALLLAITISLNLYFTHVTIRTASEVLQNGVNSSTINLRMACPLASVHT